MRAEGSALYDSELEAGRGDFCHLFLETMVDNMNIPAVNMASNKNIGHMLRKTQSLQVVPQEKIDRNRKANINTKYR
jgi:hypothetical protein